MNKICVFCGSSMGFDAIYQDAASRLGKVIVDNHCELLYGGGNVGLMKVIADAVMQGGGVVTGVMPKHLMKMEVGHDSISQMIETDTMAERKIILEEQADAFIAMPGGIGTLDELAEVAVLAQLRIFDKPLALYNIKGYYDGLIAFLQHGVKEGFIRREHVDNIIVSDDPEDIIARLKAFQPVSVGKWIDDIKEESK